MPARAAFTVLGGVVVGADTVLDGPGDAVLGGDCLADDDDARLVELEELCLVCGQLGGDVLFVDFFVKGLECGLAVKGHLGDDVVVDDVGVSAQQQRRPVWVVWPSKAFAGDAGQVLACELCGPGAGAEALGEGDVHVLIVVLELFGREVWSASDKQQDGVGHVDRVGQQAGQGRGQRPESWSLETMAQLGV